MSSTLITITDLIKSFPIGKGEFIALNKINLSFDKGEFAGLVGPSGSGKTTLLNIIGSLDIFKFQAFQHGISFSHSINESIYSSYIYFLQA